MSTTTRFCLFVVLFSLLVLGLQAARVDRMHETGQEGRNKDAKELEAGMDAKKTPGSVSEEERLQSMNEMRKRFYAHEAERDWPSAEEATIPQRIRDQFGAIDNVHDGDVEDSRCCGGRRQQDGRSRGDRGKGLHGENDSDLKTLIGLFRKIKSGLIKWLQKVVELE
ncbi:hypothetical protein TSMEX_001571 [Taenia solium]|eukprot:TsM_000432000 transcript=TsM_000432000 gene=TsM_000432000